MKRISEWFDRHMKTRIALQLVLDGGPFVLFAFPFVLGIIEVNCPTVPIPQWLDAMATISMQCVMYGGAAVLFILGVWLSSQFEQCSWCRTLSVILRVLGFAPAVLSVGLFIGFAWYYFKNM